MVQAKQQIALSSTVLYSVLEIMQKEKVYIFVCDVYFIVITLLQVYLHAGYANYDQYLNAAQVSNLFGPRAKSTVRKYNRAIKGYQVCTLFTH